MVDLGLKNVVRFNLWIDPSFDALLCAQENIGLSICDVNGPDGENWASLEEAHIYHVSAAKDELPSTWFVTEELLRRCTNLLCVSSSGAGYDTVDLDACTQAGVLVVNQAGGNANSVAEHTFALMLALTRRVVESNTRLQKEQGFSREDLMGHELYGKTLGLIGLGFIGRRVAQIARVFGMSVLAYDPFLSAEEIAAHGARSISFDELLTHSDIVSLHCPRTAQTMGMFKRPTFEKMKRGSLFITTARGGIHEETALFDALESGRLAGAGLDVWAQEPPSLNNPLLGLRNVVSTFHTAGVTHEARRNMATIAAQQIADLCAGICPKRIVNPQALPKFTERFQQLLGASVS